MSVYQPLQSQEFKNFRKIADQSLENDDIKSKEDFVTVMKMKSSFSIKRIRELLPRYELELQNKLTVLT